MIVTQAIRDRVTAKLQEGLTRAEKIYGVKYKMPIVKYDLRGKTAGRACMTRSTLTVKFNSVLLMEFTDDYIKRTVPHELAHTIDWVRHPENYNRYGRKNILHGNSWKNIMVTLGADYSRCHSFDTTKSAVRESVKHVYSCQTCAAEMKLGAVRHKRMQSGASKYWKRGCGRHAGFTYVGLDGADNAPLPTSRQPTVRVPTLTVLDPKPARVGSKLDLCRGLYDNGLNRAQMISLFVTGANCTIAGAATYYAKIKKENS
jgi:SprT protein